MCDMYTILQLHDELSNFDSLLSDAQYVLAAQSAVVMSKLLRELIGETEDCDVRIVKAMRVCIIYDTCVEIVLCLLCFLLLG